MTLKDYEEFKHTLKSIVYKTVEIKDAESHIKQMTRYDNNGSHQKAILKSITTRNELKEQLVVMLDGKTYEQWSATSKKLSKGLTQLSIAKKRETKVRTEIDETFFNFKCLTNPHSQTDISQSDSEPNKQK